MQQQTPSAEHPTGQLVNILLVDDQPANLLALEAVLADLGHNLVKASSGEDALRRLLTHDFAVILLDVQMHGMDGFETARLIRDRENSRLRESEQRFARFMQYLPGLAWIKDLQGRYVYANDAALKTFRAPQAIHGKTDDELFTPQTAALFKQNDERAIASGTGVQVI